MYTFADGRRFTSDCNAGPCLRLFAHTVVFSKADEGLSCSISNLMMLFEATMSLASWSGYAVTLAGVANAAKAYPG